MHLHGITSCYLGKRTAISCFEGALNEPLWKEKSETFQLPDFLIRITRLVLNWTLSSLQNPTKSVILHTSYQHSFSLRNLFASAN